MYPHSLRVIAWALAIAAISAVTRTDPPAGERALLGWTPRREVGSSNLRLAHVHGQVSAERALLGKLAPSEAQGTTDEAIQIRPHPIDGSNALLGRP
jgi:hypothetical protein